MKKQYHGIILTDVADLEIRIRPYGAYKIAHTLRVQGYNIIVIDMYSTRTLEQLEEILSMYISSETLFVGYSSSLFFKPFETFTDAPNSKEYYDTYSHLLPNGLSYFTDTNKIIKKLNPNLKIIFGGAITQSFAPLCKQLNSSFGVDILVHGYSEAMIVDILNRIKNNQSQKFSSKIDQMYVIEYDKRGDLYDFHNDEHRWDESDFIEKNESLPIEIARGCVFKCKFCNFPLLGKHPKDTSYIRREDKLYSEFMENYERFGTTHYAIVDDTFNERTDKIEMLLRIKEKTKIELDFSAYIRLDIVAKKQDQISLLCDLNLNYYQLGIETLNYESAKAVGKGCSTEEIKDVLYKIKDHYRNKGKFVGISSGFIIGLPHETRKTLEEWVPWVMDKDCPIDHVLFRDLRMVESIFEKSIFTENPEKYGYTLGTTKHSWSNAEWTSEECYAIANELNQRAIDNDRIKISGFQSNGITRLGYNHHEVIQTTVNEFRTGDKFSDFHVRNKKYVEDYFENLYRLGRNYE